MAQNQPTQRIRRASAIHPVTRTDTVTDDDIYNTRLPTSTRRYNRQDDTQVIRQGNKQLVVHYQNPPMQKRAWLIPAGMGMIATLVLIVIVSWVWNVWTAHQTDVAYGYPRIWQTDAVVGHNDSDQHPSHFIFENLHGRVLIIEISGGDPTHSRIYVGPTLVGNGADQAPVTGSFDDETGKGTIDMVVHVEDQRIVFFNDGTQFKQQQQ